jgi:hypothetical protein
MSTIETRLVSIVVGLLLMIGSFVVTTKISARQEAANRQEAKRQEAATRQATRYRPANVERRESATDIAVASVPLVLYLGSIALGILGAFMTLWGVVGPGRPLTPEEQERWEREQRTKVNCDTDFSSSSSSSPYKEPRERYEEWGAKERAKYDRG